MLFVFEWCEVHNEAAEKYMNELKHLYERPAKRMLLRLLENCINSTWWKEMLSIISVINDDVIAKEFLLRGLSRQNTRYDLILLNNKGFSYSSAAQAYNEGSTKATGDYLMFIHQDVLLPSPNWLKEAENLLTTLSNLGVAGVAGMLQPTFINDFEVCARFCMLQRLNLIKVWYQRYARGNVFHGYERKPWWGKFTSEVLSTRTLDELLLIIPAKVFENSKFDEEFCDNWHLYGVDYSLSAYQKGRDVCVLPNPVVHLSFGKADTAYFKTLMKLIEKYRSGKIINTTFGPWSTRSKLTEMQIDSFLLKEERTVNHPGAIKRM
jgi:hypothetical protein